MGCNRRIMFFPQVASFLDSFAAALASTLLADNGISLTSKELGNVP
jgi:hypothetical protein